VVLITGLSNDGKSTLARQLGGGRVVTIATDAVLRRLVESMQRPDTPILRVLVVQDGRVRVGDVVRKLGG
jgi:dephospho-CoA kinase